MNLKGFLQCISTFRYELFAHPNDPTAAQLEASSADCMQSVNSVLIRMRRANLLIVCRAGIDVVVDSIHAAGLEAVRLIRGQ